MSDQLLLICVVLIVSTVQYLIIILVLVSKLWMMLSWSLSVVCFWLHCLDMLSTNRKSCALLTVYWIMQCFTSPPTHYRLHGRWFLQVKRPNQQYQSTEGKSTKENQTTKTTKYTYACDDNRQKRIQIYITTSPPVYTNMGWLGDGSRKWQVRQAWTALGLPLWYLCADSDFEFMKGLISIVVFVVLNLASM